MAFAGEVFPEWYWGPIFFAVVFGPVLAGVALAADFAITRWVRRLSWREHAALWGAVFVRADDFFGGPVIVSRYDVAPGASAFAYQQRPREVSLQDGRCALRRLAGTGTNFFDGPCRELRTPRRRVVYLGTSEPPLVGDEAFALLDGTLVRLQHDRLPDRDVLAYFDALRPVAPDELDFKGG